ncbi:MAG TPA: hypothetical protein VJK48_01895, partial [Chlamydiales bacterium]|nr:hypothetical protein [Chlamydiales bacterium]
FIERINSVVTTLKRQGKECLDYLVAALSAWKVGSPAPTVFSRPCYTPEQIPDKSFFDRKMSLILRMLRYRLTTNFLNDNNAYRIK